MKASIPTRILAGVDPDDTPPAEVARDFAALLEAGARIRIAGAARTRPETLYRRLYPPKYRFELFGTRFYLAELRQNPDIRFFVAYLVQPRGNGRGLDVFARIFYKDVSLIWRSASHYVRTHDEFWIGKGDTRIEVRDGHEYVVSAEETTDLPFEIQQALDVLSRRPERIVRDSKAVALVLRGAPAGRIEPYADFTAPRRAAMANPRNRIHNDKPVARFKRRSDPTSLVFARGFEPDFKDGILEMSRSKSTLYGGKLRRYRILSVNRRIQYMFFAGPRQVWIIPPQATTTELSSFGVRTVDVICDDDLCVPGFEYHYWEEAEHEPVLVSQIPEGFIGCESEVDPSRSDASPWLDRLPVIREFRRKVLRQRA